MAMIKFETHNAFLKKVFFDYWGVWKDYFSNLNSCLVWLTFPIMIISIPFYLVFVAFYGFYLVLSFAQNFDDLPDRARILIIILKIILYIPSIAFIMFAYYPAFFVGGIIAIILTPCIKIQEKLNNVKNTAGLLNESNKGE